MGGRPVGQGTVRRGPGHQEEAGLPQEGRRIHVSPPSVGAPVSLRAVNGIDPDQPQPPIGVPDLPRDDR
jgi:hypothetical protein